VNVTLTTSITVGGDPRRGIMSRRVKRPRRQETTPIDWAARDNA